MRWLDRRAPLDEPRQVVRKLLPVWPWVLVLCAPATLLVTPRYPWLIALALAFLGGFGLATTRGMRGALYDYLTRTRRLRQLAELGAAGEESCTPMDVARRGRGAWQAPLGRTAAGGGASTIVH